VNDLPSLKVTIGIMTYNRPDFLREAVQSVLQQTYADFELIISNDYTEGQVTSDSLGISHGARVKIVNQEQTLGEIQNMNFLLENATGEWFVWLADDDLLHPEFLKLAGKSILNSQDKNIVGFYSNYIAADTPEEVFPAALKSGKYKYYSSSGFLIDYVSRKCPLVGCYGLMHTDTLRKVGGILSLGNGFSPYADILIPVLLAEHGNLCWLDEPLVFLRTHAESESCRSSDFSAFTSAEEDFLEHMKRVCSADTVNAGSEKILAELLKWFAENEWVVLCRTPSLNKFSAFIQFIKYQVSVHLKRLTYSHRINHICFIFYLIGSSLIHSAFSKSRNILEGIQSRPKKSSG